MCYICPYIQEAIGPVSLLFRLAPCTSLKDALGLHCLVRFKHKTSVNLDKFGHKYHVVSFRKIIGDCRFLSISVLSDPPLNPDLHHSLDFGALRHLFLSSRMDTCH